MPREQITHNPIIESRSDNGVLVAEERQRRNLHVSWNREPAGWIQVGIDVTVAELRSMLASAEAEAEAEARRTADIGELDRDAWPYRIVSDVIERHEANTAIRHLRRARDAAYGADE